MHNHNKQKEHILYNILIGVINTVVILEQTEQDIACRSRTLAQKNIALAKAESYRKVVFLLQEQLTQNFGD